MRRLASIRVPLKLVLLVAGVAATNHFGVERVGDFLRWDRPLALAAFAGIWATAIISILYVAFTPRAATRAFWVALVGLSTLVAETHFRVVGDRITVEALDAMRAPGAIHAATVAFYGREVAAAILTTAVLLAGLLLPPSFSGLRARGWVLLPVSPCLLIGGVILYAAGVPGHETRGLPSQFHDVVLFAIHAASPAPDPCKAEVEAGPPRPRAAEHVVLIVDESIRGDFIDLNVARGTTPYLATRPERPINFGLAVAASNCSNASNAILRLGADPERLGHAEPSLLSNPSIWKYARSAGFETFYVEAEPYAETAQNFMSASEVTLIDRVLSVPRDVPAASRDREVARLLLEILARPGARFVYVNKLGAHFPYDRFTPEGEERFRPTMRRLEPISDRSRLVNAYKNAVHGTVDGFFEELLPAVDWSRTVLLYTSDHGQNLLDDGKPVTHCRRLGQSIHEAVVPLIGWTGVAGLRRRFERAAAANFDAASHFEIFPTLLVLFGYDPDRVRERYHQSLFEDVENPMGFVSGPITGRFGRQPTWNSRAGLDELRRKSG